MPKHQKSSKSKNLKNIKLQNNFKKIIKKEKNKILPKHTVGGWCTNSKNELGKTLQVQ